MHGCWQPGVGGVLPGTSQPAGGLTCCVAVHTLAAFAPRTLLGWCGPRSRLRLTQCWLPGWLLAPHPRPVTATPLLQAKQQEGKLAGLRSGAVVVTAAEREAVRKVG